MAGNLNSRLAKVEQEFARIEEENNQAECICNVFVGISRAALEQFRTEMNRPCPAHGFRELMIIRGLSTTSRIDDPEVNALLAEYWRRLAEAKQEIYENES